MLPAHIAQDIRRQILYYLQSTFDFRNREEDEAFNRFLEDPEKGIFKGPWVSVRRPFRPAPETFENPFSFPVPFHPFLHQSRSWGRLSSAKQKPQSTIITTGTGSGKTECFLYPILDHCLRMRAQGQEGIKAIVLYPMNALAADQEKRFARVIWENEALKTAGIRVGNYTGRYDPADPGAADSGTTTMGPDHGISKHEVQMETPPDILLTNYRMLDFLLMRPKDQRIWRGTNAEVLRYLVLDELHTYDGAQGSDVACLIRRLKERLGIARGELCVVGTSATLETRPKSGGAKDDDGAGDAGEHRHERLAGFASTLFEEAIGMDAVVGEDLLRVEEIVAGNLTEVTPPSPEECFPLPNEDAMAYALRQAKAWEAPPLNPASGAKPDKAEVRAWQTELGRWIKGTPLFRHMLEVFLSAEEDLTDPVLWEDLVKAVSRRDSSLFAYTEDADREAIVGSFLALVGQSREDRDGKALLLAPTQVQIWVRELRRLGRVVSQKPGFRWVDEPDPSVTMLPAFHCSECGESGWVALHDPDGDTQLKAADTNGFLLRGDPTEIYRSYFGYAGSRSRHVVILSPRREGEESPREKQDTIPSMMHHLCPRNLMVRIGPDPEDAASFPARINQETRKLENGEVVGAQGCPFCGSQEGVFFIGSQAATLSSVAMDEILGSVLNTDPKLLAFTDSVQDASHRAGFFSARTYHFTLRTALKHVADEAGEQGVPLGEAGERLLQWGEADLPGRPGNICGAMGTLMPPDLQEYAPYAAFRSAFSGGNAPEKLRREIALRLTWETVSEFGLMQTHGRTLEPSGAVVLGWDKDLIDQTLNSLFSRLEGISPLLARVPASSWRLWLLGFLHRYRLRGALYHPYLEDLARRNFWGKAPFGRAVPGRETYPTAIRYRPRLLTTEPDRGHEYVLAPVRGLNPPWPIVWTRRNIHAPGASDTELLDAIRALLTSGEESGLFRRMHEKGSQVYYAINSSAARLTIEAVNLACSRTDREVVRPEAEAPLWEGAPSLEYVADQGQYERVPFSARQRYYQSRYSRGMPRRVVAREHTGILGFDERTNLEKEFREAKRAGDTNVLTCTSTLELGIDIGDLSTTMLCSIPPTTANYLQRIGRAGRVTGSAFIISIVNQRPHDLFFYARPREMLKGRVDPPGCWLDASAVLVRQYLGYCFDSASAEGILQELPRTAKQLLEDLGLPEGNVPRMMAWVRENEPDLQSRFLARFQPGVLKDTRERFLRETNTELLVQRIHQATSAFEQTLRELRNARRRLRDQLRNLGEGEDAARREIEAELRLLTGRQQRHSRISSLELLTDHGLLPNYAFPERGVPFYGAVYNRFAGGAQDYKPVELQRPAGAAIRELAPSNIFYTHSRQFVVQQIAVGTRQDSLITDWAICGKCGHMRQAQEVNRPDAQPSCPQCGHEGVAGQTDQGQHRPFLHFPSSCAVSFMDQYESLSADRAEERQQAYYQVVRSFDHTLEAPSGAVGEDVAPFGIEYRGAMVFREVNTGYQGRAGEVQFGPDQKVPEDGFLVCADCGVVAPPDKHIGDVTHRRNCSGRRKRESAKQQGRDINPYQWLSAYLYRELKSEAIRLLLPVVEEEDLETLAACFYLGLRLRFEGGDPAHLIVSPQVLPDLQAGLDKHYLVLMDAVPGGSGYLKTLYQEQDEQGREGEGIMTVMRLARDALMSCECRRLSQGDEEIDTDGCYRCIRTYHLQYKADMISRERGIVLLNQLIESGERRERKKELDDIRVGALFGSVLEQRFVEELKGFVQEKGGFWEQTVIQGSRGFRFGMPKQSEVWDLQLQPSLGPAHGVMEPCQPDFLLSCDDGEKRPVAIFTDGFEYHVHPNNRLSDDVKKRRAIVASGNYHVWSIAWDDLEETEASQDICLCGDDVTSILNRFSGQKYPGVGPLPSADPLMRNGFEQLKAYLTCPHMAAWRFMAGVSMYWPLPQRLGHHSYGEAILRGQLEAWRGGAQPEHQSGVPDGEWVLNLGAAGADGDVAAVIKAEHVVSVSLDNVGQVRVFSRLPDSEDLITGQEFKRRWRRFLAGINLFQFCDAFSFWTTSEVLEGIAPEIVLGEGFSPSEAWEEIREQVIGTVQPLVARLSHLDIPLPEVEFYPDGLSDEVFAELAWPGEDIKVAILTGDQMAFAEQWRARGWQVFDPSHVLALSDGEIRSLLNP